MVGECERATAAKQVNVKGGLWLLVDVRGHEASGFVFLCRSCECRMTLCCGAPTIVVGQGGLI